MCRTPFPDPEGNESDIEYISTKSGGFMGIIKPRPIKPRDMTPEEQQSAAMRYIQERYSRSVASEAEWEWARRQAGIYQKQIEGHIDHGPSYDKIIHRNPDGSDPLVQEPGP